MTMWKQCDNVKVVARGGPEPEPAAHLYTMELYNEFQLIF